MPYICLTTREGGRKRFWKERGKREGGKKRVREREKERERERNDEFLVLRVTTQVIYHSHQPSNLTPLSGDTGHA